MPGTRKKSKNTLAPSDAVHPYNSDAPRKKKTKPGPAPAGTSKRLTARKSVGGLAPRVPIQPAFGDLSPSPSPAPSQSPGIGPTPANQHRTPTPMDIDEEEEGVPETPDLEGDVWCSLCADGGGGMVICNRCKAANCFTCVPELAQVTPEELGACTYTCVACTRTKDRFLGLFKDGNPVFPRGMKLTAHNIRPAIKNRLRTPRLVIIEFILAELSDVSSTGQLMYSSLLTNYAREDRSTIHYEAIVFDLGSRRAINKHCLSMVAKVGDLRARGDFDHAIVIIHTHSDDDTGDLFYTSMDQRTKTPLSSKVPNWFSTIVGKDMGDYLREMKYSSLFVIACGAVVRVQEAREGVKEVAKTFGFTDTFAFGAPKVIGHYVTIWMLTYADRVIICGMPAVSCMSSVLYATEIGRHTSVLHIYRDVVLVEESKPEGGEDAASKGKKQEQEVLKARMYIWEHPVYRPNSYTYPIACPVCHCIRSWFPTDSPSIKRNPDGSFTLTCLTKLGEPKKGETRKTCPGEYVIGSLPFSDPIWQPDSGKWYSNEV